MVTVDVAFDEDEGCGSVGTIISDCTGGVLIASHDFVPHLVDAPMQEAYALREGLMLAQHIGCNQIIIQSDCMEVVMITQDEGFIANSAAAIYDECNTIWSGFQDIKIGHCNREANQAAHNLARRVMQVKQNCMRDDDTPSFLLLECKRCNHFE
jgi:ribonuclease HI